MNTYLLLHAPEEASLENVEVVKLFEAKDHKAAEKKVAKRVETFKKKGTPGSTLQLVSAVASYNRE